MVTIDTNGKKWFVRVNGYVLATCASENSAEGKASLFRQVILHASRKPIG